MSNNEMPKAYEANLYEDEIYAAWEKSGFFNPDHLEGEPYSIMMPPPNVTGVLHLGHALENTLMDVMVRFQRMRGKKVLLLPGTDHAAVATQAKVESLLMKEGIKHPREELGREKLLERIRAYAEESKSTILHQIKKMGTSCDWSRLAYTFDETRSKAVNEVFVRMYNDGLIYRGHRVINWSVKGQSTCSDDELVYIERPAKLYFFRYAKDFPVTIATTRPETKLGDTAVAVNPNDDRYREFIGREFTVDVGAEKPLVIKIIADEHVDPNFGTGALGVTPAHSAVDFEMYQKQKAAGDPIGFVQVIGTDGKMTTEAGKAYAGLSVEDAREKFVEHLRSQGLLEKEEGITQNVGTSDRFKDVVEALPLTQWFVDVNKEISGKGKSLIQLMREAVTIGHNGDTTQKITVTPDRFEKIYFHWIDHLRDWCISRQIWWGHRIPVWYRKRTSEQGTVNSEQGLVETFVGNGMPDGEGWEQDPDTLDTWFSSGMWTFSTLGFSESSNDLKTFHPTSWMQMGYEILFFWMARMIMMSTYTLDQIPFRDVFIHGMVRNEQGKKFSKSDENGLDPLDMINIYGADALRLSVLAGVSPGNDTRFSTEKIESARNFVNKLWNVARYILGNRDQGTGNREQEIVAKTLADKWILSRLTHVTEQTTKLIEQFDFSLAFELIREFIWSDFADWYLEIAKIQSRDPHLKESTEQILFHVLKTSLTLCHPFMPFVTEVIWREYASGKLLMIESWPIANLQTDVQAEKSFGEIQELIVHIRNVRSQYKIEPKKLMDVVFVVNDVSRSFIEAHRDVIAVLARANADFILVQKYEAAVLDVSVVMKDVTVFVKMETVVDAEKEAGRIEKEKAELTAYLESLAQKLSNEEFRSKAPEKIIQQMEEKQHEAQEKLSALRHS